LQSGFAGHAQDASGQDDRPAMPLDDRQTRQPMTLPALAWAAIFGAGLMLVLLVIGIALQLAVLKDSQKHIQAQDAKITELLAKTRAAEPFARDAVPLLREGAPLVRRARRAIGPLSRATGDVAAATERLPVLVRAGLALTDTALPVLRDIGRSDLAHVLGHAHVTLDAAGAMLAQLRAEDLIRLSAQAAREAPEFQRRLLRIQLATLATQRESVAVQRTTLEVQRQALTHIESIDRKTGGQLPAVPASSP
jgi:hypothetical protein